MSRWISAILMIFIAWLWWSIMNQREFYHFQPTTETAFIRPLKDIQPFLTDQQTDSVLAQFRAKRLSRAVQFRTVSSPSQPSSTTNVNVDPTQFNKEWDDLHSWLQKAFPRTFESLNVEKINNSLLFEWPGQRKDLRPVLLCAHLDVVPVSEETLHQWDWPPFSGEITEDGFIYGRGTLDFKVLSSAFVIITFDLPNLE
jgi:acetylornithine deacetylase/succinyl-diaminopimelate desuccinylase-like protein